MAPRGKKEESPKNGPKEGKVMKTQTTKVSKTQKVMKDQTIKNDGTISLAPKQFLSSKKNANKQRQKETKKPATKQYHHGVICASNLFEWIDNLEKKETERILEPEPGFKLPNSIFEPELLSISFANGVTEPFVKELVF